MKTSTASPTLRLVLPLLFLFLLFTSLGAAPKATYNCTIVVKVAGISMTELQDLEKATYPTVDMSLAYSCLESGILVFKLHQTQYGEKGDVKQYLSDHIHDHLNEGRSFKFLDIHIVRNDGVSKC